MLYRPYEDFSLMLHPYFWDLAKEFMAILDCDHVIKEFGFWELGR